MKTPDSIAAGLREATRLTRAGRLLDATALIQRTLKQQAGAEAGVDSPPSDREGGASGRIIDAVFSTVAEPAVPSASRLADGRVAAPGNGPARPGAVNVPAGTFIAGSYTNHAGTRPYKLYIPSSYAGQALPLVVMLHGCTQTPDDFAAGTRMNALAEEWPCFVLYPAQVRAANRSRCWNWFKRADQRRDAGEPAILAGMTAEVRARYGLDARRVYLAGLSAGGAMAAVVSATYPEVYAAIGIHSGLARGAAHDLPSALAAMRGTHAKPPGSTPGLKAPIIVFHGDRDATVHPSNGERVVSESSAGAGVTREHGRVAGGHAYTRTIHRDPSARIVLEHWLVHGGGHAWFGGSDQGSFTDPRGPDATREMMRFFRQHP